MLLSRSDHRFLHEFIPLQIYFKGLGYGLYDGLSGFIMQPVRGARSKGASGFVQGLGRGVGGLVFKPAAGACGVPGYAFKGIVEEVR